MNRPLERACLGFCVKAFSLSDRPGGHLTRSIGIQTPKRLKKHPKMDGYSTPPERHVRKYHQFNCWH